jgi:hypothetical protein
VTNAVFEMIATIEKHFEKEYVDFDKTKIFGFLAEHTNIQIERITDELIEMKHFPTINDIKKLMWKYPKRHWQYYEDLNTEQKEEYPNPHYKDFATTMGIHDHYKHGTEEQRQALKLPVELSPLKDDNYRHDRYSTKAGWALNQEMFIRLRRLKRGLPAIDPKQLQGWE